MIARISILIVLLTLLPDLYIYRCYIRKCPNQRPSRALWLRLLWWLPSVVLLGWTAAYCTLHNFVPNNLRPLNTFLLLLGLIVVPKLLFTLSSLMGRLVQRLLHVRRNWGDYVSVLFIVGWFYVLYSGAMVGPNELQVRRVTLQFKDLPKSFDGYRIVQFSDIHLGSMSEDLTRRIVSQIQELAPDMIVFTGDIQNMYAREISRHSNALIHLHADDGVYTILGNHDYADYVKAATPEQRPQLERLTREAEVALNWDLLLNERRIVRRGNDSIVIAGAENDGLPPFPSKADYAKTLHGISPSAFVIMLQHDPSAWRRHILTETNAQLTLSGHTHGGQFSLFGLRPTSLTYTEDAGLYREGDRYINVSTGIGGVLPFRFHMNPEIVEITLKVKQ